ncbi:MAG: tubulin-like doman-containing protein [Promethearchaeota archaeon]
MPFIFIGTGGMGKETVARIKYLTEEANMKNVFFLGLDIDRRYSTDFTRDIPMPSINVSNPAQEIGALVENKEFLKWWPKGHQIYTSLSGSSAAGQIRINGRYALFSRYIKIKNEIISLIKQAKNIANVDPNDDNIYVFLITSLGGGTGAGIFLDISFIIRNEIGDRHRLYGVLYDGTITKAFAEKTLHLSYAAISELEYWLQNHKKYEMEFSGGEKLSGADVGTRLFDIVFLIQAETSDTKRFRSTEGAVSPYIPMVVEALFSLISIPDFKRYVVANNWNRFDNLSTSGMQIKYGSFGVGTITYGEHQVLNYVVDHLIKEHLLHFESEVPEVNWDSFEETVEKPLYIGERIDQSLSNRIFHTNESYNTINSRLESLQRKINIESKVEEIKKLKSQFHIPLKSGDSYIGWEKLYIKYKSDIQSSLYNKRMEFERTLEERIGEYIKNRVVDLDKLIDWLDNAVGVIEKNEDYIKKYKERIELQKAIENIGNAWISLIKKRKTLLGRVKLEYKSKLINAISSWVREEISQIEFYEMKNFYGELIKTIKDWQNIVNILQNKINKVRAKIDTSIGRYTGRNIAYNLDSLTNREFPLHIKLDINKELIEKFILHGSVLQNKGIMKQLENIKDVVYSGRGQYLGIKDHFATIRKEVNTGREKEVREQGVIDQQLLELFRAVFEEVVSPLLYSIRIDDIIEYWLKEQIYPVAKSYYDEGNIQKKLQLKEQWSLNFGDEGAEALLSDQYFENQENKEEWFEIALRSFILNFKNKINPFIRYNEQIKKNYWEKINLDSDSRDAFSDKIRIFVPEKFKFLKILKKGSNENITEIKSSHNKIKVFAESYGFPLHALDIVSGVQEHRMREEYLRHRDIMKMELEKNEYNRQIRHVDKRFYSSWRLDIGSEEIKDIQGYWLYIFGLGLEFIKRDYKKKFILEISGRRKTISTSLPKALGEIRHNDNLRESLKSIVVDTMKETHYKDKDYSKIEDIVKNAYKIHNQLEPVQTNANIEAYNIWREIEDSIHVNERGEFSRISKVPKSWVEMEKLLDSL